MRYLAWTAIILSIGVVAGGIALMIGGSDQHALIWRTFIIVPFVFAWGVRELRKDRMGAGRNRVENGKY